MKSIPTSCIKHNAKQNEIQPLDVYKQLYDGEK